MKRIFIFFFSPFFLFFLLSQTQTLIFLAGLKNLKVQKTEKKITTNVIKEFYLVHDSVTHVWAWLYKKNVFFYECNLKISLKCR